MRNGTSTEESLKKDYEILNKKIINESNFVSNDWRDAPIIVGRNLLREQLNMIKIRQYSQTTKNKVIKHGSNSLLTKRVNAMITTLEEKDTENLMTNLPLVYKGNVLINLNEYHNTDIILKEMPKYLLVKKINNNSNNNLKFDHLPIDLIPIFPQTVTFAVKPKCAALGTKSVSVRRTQFPLTPAYALTAYKAQGKTLNKVIIDLTKPPSGKLDFAYAYVALSRAKSLNDIFILRDFDIKMLSPNIPVDYFLEIDRLKSIEVLSN